MNTSKHISVKMPLPHICRFTLIELLVVIAITAMAFADGHTDAWSYGELESKGTGSLTQKNNISHFWHGY